MTDTISAGDDRPEASGDGGGDRDRGQLVLVAGLALAVVLVALVLVTNTAIYTENLATRDDGVGEAEALGYRAAVVDGVGGIVDRENAAEYDDRTALKANVSAGVAELDILLRESAARRSASATVNRSAATYVDGRLVRENGTAADPHPFTNETGAANWTVATDLNETRGARGYVAVVNGSDLASASESDPDDAFHVVVTNGTTSWHAYVYKDTADGEITIAVKAAGDSVSDTTEVCSTPAANATVDFTGGTLDGEDCGGFALGGDVAGRYDLLVRNGDVAGGGYDLTVRTEGAGAVSSGNVTEGASVDSPYSVPAVYAVRVPVVYETADLEYRTTVRVAPGERDA